jgi:hypothetical protein
MTRTKICALLLLALSSLLASPVSAADQRSLEAARELLGSTGTSNKLVGQVDLSAMASPMRTVLTAKYPSAKPADIDAVVKEFIRLLAKDVNDEAPKIVDMFAQVYAETFTAQELRDLDKFYASKAGKKYADMQNVVSPDNERIRTCMLNVMTRARTKGTMEAFADAIADMLTGPCLLGGQSQKKNVDPERLALIDEINRMSLSEEGYQQLFTVIIGSVMSIADVKKEAGAGAKLKEFEQMILTRVLAKYDAWIDVVNHLLVDKMSKSEMREVAAVMKTPTFRKFSDATPELVSKLLTTMVKWVSDRMQVQLPQAIANMKAKGIDLGDPKDPKSG